MEVEKFSFSLLNGVPVSEKTAVNVAVTSPILIFDATLVLVAVFWLNTTALVLIT